MGLSDFIECWLKTFRSASLGTTVVGESKAYALRLSVAIFDVFPFSNELDLLELRFHVLDPYVDYFVLSEATSTFSGKPKPLHFLNNAGRFKQFEKKIINFTVEEEFFGTPFERDRFQKDKLKEKLVNICAPEDLILFSDVDEIPNPVELELAFGHATNGRISHMAQNLYYYYLNLQEISGTLLSITGEFPNAPFPKWLGTKVLRFGTLINYTMTELRSPECKFDGVRIANGGWHFSYCGGEPGVGLEKRVRTKIDDFAHQELVTFKNRLRLSGRVSKKHDPFGRRGATFERVPVDGTYPRYLISNQDKYAHMILPE